MKKAMLYIHGRGGSFQEIAQYQECLLDYDMIGVDYQDDDSFSLIQEKILHAYHHLHNDYAHIELLANSIGAYWAMLTLQNQHLYKAFLISPILDMETLILDMMRWANVSETELSEKKNIPTTFHETLSWDFLCFVRNHPITWNIPTEILYAQNDHLTSLTTLNQFIKEHQAHLTIMTNGEHWFHTDEQMKFLKQWLYEKTHPKIYH